MPDPETSSLAEIAAYREGKRAGLALAALAVAVMAFINLLSFEKSLLALVLAVIALSGGMAAGAARQWARLAILLAVAHWLLLTSLITLFHRQLGQLVTLLLSLT